MESLGPILLVLVVIGSLIGTVLYIWSIVWAYRDAEKRGRNGLLVALLVALVAWPLGLVIWLFVRDA